MLTFFAAPSTGPVGERVSIGGVRHYRLPSGRLAPSVTTVLDVIAKPHLDAWLDRQEAAKRDAAVHRTCREVLPKFPSASIAVPSQADFLRAYSQAQAALAAEARVQLSAAEIGTLVHDAIAWVLRSEMGLPTGDMP